MSHAKLPEKTDVSMDENVMVTRERRSFLGIISWWVEQKVDSLGKDLIISTAEKYDRVILNGEQIK